MADKKAPTRSVHAIEQELDARRNRLAGTVDELVYRTSPVELKRRAMEQVKATADTKKTQLVDTVNAKTRTEEGDIDLKVVAMGLAAVGGVALLFGTLRALFHK